MDVLNAFQKSTKRTADYEHKMAILGVKGLMKAAYNFVIGLTQNKKVKTFDSELEAKEWLVSD
jgi:hypothetical protein